MRHILLVLLVVLCLGCGSTGFYPPIEGPDEINLPSFLNDSTLLLIENYGELDTHGFVWVIPYTSDRNAFKRAEEQGRALHRKYDEKKPPPGW